MGLTRQASRTRSDRSVGLFVLDYLRVKTFYPRPPVARALAHALAFATVLSDPRTSTTPPLSSPNAARAASIPSSNEPASSSLSSPNAAPSRGTLRRVGGEELCRVVLVPLRRVVPRGDERLRLRCSFPPPATSTVVKTTISIFARTISRRNPTWSLSAAIATTAAIFVARGKNLSRRRRRRRRRLGRVRAVRHQPPTRIVPGHDHLETPRGFGAFESASHVFVVDGPRRASVSILRRAPLPRVKTRRRRARGAFSRWCGPNRDMRTPDITRS